MGIVTPGFQLVDVRNEDLLSYDSDGVARLHGTTDAEVSFARLLPGKGIALRARSGAEEDALVLSGRMAYGFGGQEVGVERGNWLVARPEEERGYWNRTTRPATLLLFAPAARPTAASTRSPVFYSIAGAKSRQTVYETETSRGELLTLRPGETHTLVGVRFAVAHCLDGRAMCLMRGDKLALESGEGVCLIHKPSDLVGASGHSTVAVFSTRF